MDALETTQVLTLLAMWNVRVNAHGRMIEPPNRASVWRLGYDVEKNYNDNELNCGGFRVQWLINGGRCGFCGDPYTGPREHESGGKYASGVISRKYRSGEVINITIDITANHGGYFRFFLCPKSRLTEKCFREYPLRVVDEGYVHKLRKLQSPMMEHLQVHLPEGVRCKHCVLQWRWNCGQSYGLDFATGTYCKGCGPQEQFWNCADIAIESGGVIPRHLGDFNHVSGLRPTLLQDKPIFGKLFPSVKTTDLQADQPPPPFRHVPEQTTVQCRGSLAYGVMLDAWCKRNCGVGYCPPSHCTCM